MSLVVTDVTVGDRPGRAVHVVDGRIAWLGDAGDAPAADRTIAGEGALLTPAFVDAHVHATATGLALTGLDLHSSVSLAAAVASVTDHARTSDGIVLGTGWDETAWPERRGLTRADLDAVRRPGVVGDGRDGGGKAHARVEVEPGEGQPGRRRVHVGVDEGRREQRPLPRDRPLGGRRRAGVAQPGDPAVDDVHGAAGSVAHRDVGDQQVHPATRGSMRARTPGSER